MQMTKKRRMFAAVLVFLFTLFAFDGAVHPAFAGDDHCQRKITPACLK
jgi:hypothetical protein